MNYPCGRATLETSEAFRDVLTLWARMVYGVRATEVDAPVDLGVDVVRSWAERLVDLFGHSAIGGVFHGGPDKDFVSLYAARRNGVCVLSTDGKQAPLLFWDSGSLVGNADGFPGSLPDGAVAERLPTPSWWAVLLREDGEIEKAVRFGPVKAVADQFSPRHRAEDWIIIRSDRVHPRTGVEYWADVALHEEV